MEYLSKEDGDKFLLNHLEKVCKIQRDFTSQDSKLLKDQWRWFQGVVDDWYDNNYISESAYNKATEVIDYLINMKKRIESYEETTTLHISK